MTSNSLVTDTPLGRLVLTESNGYLTECRFTDDGPLSADSVATKASPVLRATVAQLNDYFCGQRRNFELPLAPAGTDFQRRVWALLQTIPYGETRSYQQLARQIGKANASRAVGSANGKNPISIIIPCHRVLRTSGHLGGYAGGLDRKSSLLELERQGGQRGKSHAFA